MTEPIHKELIIAWANGAQIECYDISHKTWKYCKEPRWHPELKYRIKKENKTKKVFVNLYLNGTFEMFETASSAKQAANSKNLAIAIAQLVDIKI